MIITAKYGLHHFRSHWLKRKYNLTILPFKSLGAFCCHGNQTKWSSIIILAIFKSSYFEFPLPKQHFYYIWDILLEFWSCHFIIPFYKNLMSSWQPNKETDRHNFSHWIGFTQVAWSVKLGWYCFSGFKRVVVYKLSFLNYKLPCQPNKTVAGHKTQTLSRQLLYDLYW